MQPFTLEVPPADDPTLVTTLVVDDEDAIRTALGRFLVGIGHEVVSRRDRGRGARRIAPPQAQPASCSMCAFPMVRARSCSQLLEHEPYVAILMLTAVNDAQAGRALHAARGDGLSRQAGRSLRSRTGHRARPCPPPGHDRTGEHPGLAAPGDCPARRRVAPGAGESGADLGGHPRSARQCARGEGRLPPRTFRPGGRSLGDGGGRTRAFGRAGRNWSGRRAACTTSARSAFANRC